MKKLLTVSLTSAILFSGVSYIAPNSADAAPNSEFNNSKKLSNYRLNVELLKLINKERKTNGVAPIKYISDKKIKAGTNKRAVEVTKYFSHYRPNGTLFKTAFPKSQQPFIKGENVMKRSIKSTETPSTDEKYLAQLMFNQWKQSKDHRANMLRPNFKRSSIAMKVAYDTNKQRNYYYAVQIFTTK